jgi:hypothetical protein
MDALPRFTFALLLARGLGAADTGAALVLAGLPVVLVIIVVVAGGFAGTNGCATAVIGFSEGFAVVFAASGFSLVGFCVLSGIGLKAGPAALAIVIVVQSVLSVQIYA